MPERDAQGSRRLLHGPANSLFEQANSERPVRMVDVEVIPEWTIALASFLGEATTFRKRTARGKTLLQKAPRARRAMPLCRH